MSLELRGMVERLDQIADEEAARLRDDPRSDTVDATVVMMLFESPPAEPLDTDAGVSSHHDQLDDVLPPA